MQWSDINFNPTNRVLRQFAGIALVLFGALAVLEAEVRHRPNMALIYAAAALLIGPLGLALPKLIKPVFDAWLAPFKDLGVAGASATATSTC